MSDHQQFQPTHDRVLIRRQAALKQTAAGIYLPEAAAEKHAQRIATVVATGPGLWDAKAGAHHPVCCRPGDVVMYGEYTGEEINLGGDVMAGTEMIVVRDGDILGVLLAPREVDVPRDPSLDLGENPVTVAWGDEQPPGDGGIAGRDPGNNDFYPEATGIDGLPR